MIALHVPDLDGDVQAYIRQSLASGQLGHGPFVERLEVEVARRVGRRCAVALSSGTAALHLALLVLGIGPGDEVLMSDLSFVAPANAIRYVGAEPLFVDADDTWQMSGLLLGRWCERWLRNGRNQASGRHVRAILPVHILGGMCDMAFLGEIAKSHNLWVIEDASQALGARRGGCPAGKLGDIACLSFNSNKTVAGPGGGMLLTDQKNLAARARYLAWQARDGPGYRHGEVGYNYRMADLQAAVILAQVERLQAILAVKRAVAEMYRGELAGLPGIAPMPVPPGTEPSWWLWTAAVPDRRRLQVALYNQGIESRPVWEPLHFTPAHRGTYCAGRGVVAKWVWERALSLPSSPGLGTEGAHQVAAAVRGFLLTSGKAQTTIRSRKEAP